MTEPSNELSVYPSTAAQRANVCRPIDVCHGIFEWQLPVECQLDPGPPRRRSTITTMMMVGSRHDILRYYSLLPAVLETLHSERRFHGEPGCSLDARIPIRIHNSSATDDSRAGEREREARDFLSWINNNLLRAILRRKKVAAAPRAGTCNRRKWPEVGDISHLDFFRNAARARLDSRLTV